MQLSAIVKEYDVPLTRAERDLVTQLGPGVSTLSEEQYEKRMKALVSAREALKRLPDKKESERQRRMEKAQRLKERLKMLRQMMPFISPSAAKSLKAEMKQIAAQLASLDAGGSTGSTIMPPTEVPTLDTQEAAAGNQVEDTRDGSNGGGEKYHAVSVLVQENQSKSDESSGNRQLKETVEELKALYKSVLAALKRKQSGRGSTSTAPPYLRVYTTIPDTTDSFTLKI